MSGGTKKPVEIITSNKWSKRPNASDELEVEMDRLTIALGEHKKSLPNNHVDPVVHFNEHEIIDEDDRDDGVSSTVPVDYREKDRLFHLNFIRLTTNRQTTAYPKIYKNGTRKSLSFSNERMREIERTNHILLQKILSKGPKTQQRKAGSVPTSLIGSQSQSRVTSATVNRRKQQRQIDLDNELLRKKLLTISQRK